MWGDSGAFQQEMLSWLVGCLQVHGLVKEVIDEDHVICVLMERIMSPLQNPWAVQAETNQADGRRHACLL